MQNVHNNNKFRLKNNNQHIYNIHTILNNRFKNFN